MAEIEVEDIIRKIQESAREQASLRANSPSSPADGAADALARLQTCLTMADRARDQLPPLTTYRRGPLARLELWIKRQLKRATRWYTWEQVNFNSAVHTALDSVSVALSAHQQQLARMQSRPDAAPPSTADVESGSALPGSRTAALESHFAALLAGEVERLRAEQQERCQLLLDEQRVCFKQLALEISETGVVADRAKRNIQLRLDELASHVEALRAMQVEIEELRRAIGARSEAE